jgi:uncharacterized protein YggE
MVLLAVGGKRWMRAASRAVLRGVTVLMLVAAAAASAPLAAIADEDTPQRVLSLSATGTVTAKPDMATVSIGAKTTAPTAAKALVANEAIMARLFKGLKARGIDEKDIRTSEFAVSPRYKHQHNMAPVLTGYEVSNSLAVVMRKLDDLGRVLDEMVKLGANEINQVQFGFSNSDELKDKARRAAVKIAQARARLYAEAAGVSLGPVLSISEGGFQGPPRDPRVYARAVAVSPDSVTIASGQQEVRAVVHMSWALEK